VFLIALTVAGATAVLFGLAPAWQATRAQPALVLKEESSTFGAGVGLRKVLVVGQIALALILLIGAGLFVRTLGGLRAKGPGFDTTNQVMIRLDLARSGYTQPQSQHMLRNLLDAFKGLPSTQSAALSVSELLSGGSWNQRLTIDRGQRTVTESVVHCNAVSPSFFDTLGVRLIAGRDFNDHDARDAGSTIWLGTGQAPFRTVIVNESFVRHYFGERSPIGARIGLGNRPDTRTDIEVVGVVSTFSYRGLRETDDQAFFPFFEGSFPGGTFWLRTRTESSAAFASIRAAVRQFDPALPIGLRTLDDQLDRTLVNERLLATLASAFAALALLLAVIGVYGFMSFVVSRRTREIGIRRALGASQGDTVWLIAREAIVMLIAGVALALPAVWGLGRFVESQLFGVRAMDWPTIVAAAALLALVAVAASGLPLRRATSISPSQALRAE
jgi:predicted permease